MPIPTVNSKPPPPAGGAAPSASSRGTSPTLSAQGGRNRHTPLLTLAPDALPQHATASPKEEDISAIWNVISRASEVVKDGERLENLAWRHWGQPHCRRRSSSSTMETASTISVSTSSDRSGEHMAQRSADKRSFAGTLKLLVEESSFKDWVEDAKRHLPPITKNNGTASSTPSAPTLALPDTPVPDVEIRLVEPTPVPSRVGSLGHGSLGQSTHLSTKASSQPLVREGIHEEIDSAAENPPVAAASSDVQQTPAPQTRRKGKGFFIQSSPGKASGSESSQPNSLTNPSSPPAVAPPPAAKAEPPRVDSPSSHWRSSDDSSSAIVVLKKKERQETRRNVSMTNMRGRFQGEKRQAAQAIAARNQPDEDDDDWEDDDDDDGEEGEEEEEEEEKEEEEGDQENGDGDDNDDEDWEDEDSVVQEAPPVAPPAPKRAVTIVPPAPTPPRTKEERARRAAEKARLEAERDAQRKREMFAKQQIFGRQPAQSEGLLTRTFRTGKSMLDLTQARDEEDEHSGLRRAPTATQLGQLSQSPMAAGNLLRSKSVVAMPVQTGVSVTSQAHSGHSGGHSGHSGGSEDKRGPEGVEMESSDEDSDDDNYLASSQVQRKLDEMAAKRAAREQRSQSIPTPVESNNGDLDEHGIVRPLSPTTRRRTIIMREMSESLRRNIILEREKSAGGTKPHGHSRPPPSVHTSRLPTSSSAVNLAQYSANYGAPLQRHQSNLHFEVGQVTTSPPIERHSSHPNLTAMEAETRGNGQVPAEYRAAHPSASPHAPPHPARAATSPSPDPQSHSISPNEQMRRRQNVLGGGFLRPLTRAEPTTGLGRTRSTANITSGHHSEGMSPSPTHKHAPSRLSPVHAMGHIHAPAMVRSNTEGDQTDAARQRYRRDLARRGEHSDPSYRMHGW